MTHCLIKDTATSPRTMKLCIVVLTMTENNDNHSHFFFLLLDSEGQGGENCLAANIDNYKITTKSLLTTIPGT